MLINANEHDDVMVDAIFYHQKKRSLKLDKVMKGGVETNFAGPPWPLKC